MEKYFIITKDVRTYRDGLKKVDRWVREFDTLEKATQQMCEDYKDYKESTLHTIKKAKVGLFTGIPDYFEVERPGKVHEQFLVKVEV